MNDDSNTPESSLQAESTHEPAASTDAFQSLEGIDESEGSLRDLDMIKEIPVNLKVELGRTRMTISKLLELGEGSVIELDGLAGNPLNIYVNDYLIASGEVVVVEDKYGVRVNKIITPSERVHKLNG